MEQTKRSFEVTVEGQYHSLGDLTGTPTLKNYKAKFILPSNEAMLSIICRHLLAPYLRKNYSDFIRYRTHKITSVVAHGRTPDPSVVNIPIEEMNISQLSDFCILSNIMIDPYKHTDLPLCREVVRRSYVNSRQYKKDIESSKMGKEQKEADELRELNKLPSENADSTQININEHKATIAARANVTPPPTKIVIPQAQTEETVPLESDEPLPPMEESNELFS